MCKKERRREGAGEGKKEEGMQKRDRGWEGRECLVYCIPRYQENWFLCTVIVLAGVKEPPVILHVHII